MSGKHFLLLLFTEVRRFKLFIHNYTNLQIMKLGVEINVS